MGNYQASWTSAMTESYLEPEWTSLQILPQQLLWGSRSCKHLEFRLCGMLNRRHTQAYQTFDLHKLRGKRFVLFSRPNLVGSCYSSERQQIALLQEAGITWSHQDSAKSLAQHESDALAGGSLGVAESRGLLLHLFSSQREHALPLNSRYYYNDYKAKNKINSNT